MEDFSFPLKQDHDSSHLHHLPFPHFTTSPLWFLPSVAPLESSSYSPHSKSLSASDKGTRNGKHVEQQITVTDEEKMDMLWEDFNEELIQASHESDIDLTNRPLVHRTPSLILFIKVIRKLLFLHKIGAKRRSSSSSTSSVY
jgi:hypothetical protein